MDSIVQTIHKGVRMIVALMMGALILMVFCQVVLRFIFDSSFVWVEELGRFVFMWLMFLGITVGVVQLRHIQVTVFVDRLRGSWGKTAHVVALAASAVFFGYLAYLGSEFAQLNMNGLSALLEMNLGYVYAVLPLSASVCFIYCVVQIVDALRGKTAERRDASGHDSVC